MVGDDGWLGWFGRWVARLVGDGLLGWFGRWVARLVAHLLATAALWVRIQNPDISKNYKMGDISKGVPIH